MEATNPEKMGGGSWEELPKNFGDKCGGKRGTAWPDQRTERLPEQTGRQDRQGGPRGRKRQRKIKGEGVLQVQ